MEVENPLEELIGEYLFELNSINGYLYQVKNRIESHVKRLISFYEENGIKIDDLFTGTSLVIGDLSEFPPDGWRRNYITGKHSKKGNDYLSFSEDLIQREAILSIALGYERLETFLKKICSKFLLLNKEFINKDAYTSFIRRYNGDKREDLQYWHEYLKLSYKGKNNKYLLKFLREVNLDFKILETNNNRSLNLKEWFEVSSIVRHSIIHSNSLIDEKELTKLNVLQTNILKEYFPGEVHGHKYMIKLDYKSANTQLVRLAEYGFLVFKCLSITAKYKWEIFEYQKEL